MKKLETRNGALVFVEVPESCPEYEYKEKESMPFCLMVGYHFGTPKRLLHSPIILPECENGYEILGEVTKEGITFDCGLFIEPLKYSDYEFGSEGLSESMQESIENDYEFKKEPNFRFMMRSQGIKLREGYKFIVLKEK